MDSPRSLATQDPRGRRLHGSRVTDTLGHIIDIVTPEDERYKAQNRGHELKAVDMANQQQSRMGGPPCDGLDTELPAHVKLTYAASIAKVEAELQAVVAELAKQRRRRAAEAKMASSRIANAGTRNPVEIWRVAWAAAIAALIVWAISLTTLVVIGA